MRSNLKLLALIIILSLPQVVFAKARPVTCPQKYPARIRVPFGDAMVMKFPEKPKHSLPGKSAFDFKYIGRDIGIKSLAYGTTANLFVYLGKKMCAFRLISVKSNADDIVVVKYPKETTVRAKYVK